MRLQSHDIIITQTIIIIFIVYSGEYSSVVLKTLNNISASLNRLQKKKGDRRKFDHPQVYLQETQKKNSRWGEMKK